MSKSILITGNSHGIGKALTDEYLKQGEIVYGLSRSGYSTTSKSYIDVTCDLAREHEIESALAKLLKNVTHLDAIFLNAGILGNIEQLKQTPVKDIRHVMDINVWANKHILDYCEQNKIQIDQVIALSSGAAVNGNKGWGSYSLSKATLNMLVLLYSREMTDTHFCALAPGLVNTAMQDYLCDESKVDIEQFPSVEKMRTARRTGTMTKPADVAKTIIELLPRLTRHESGSFLDVRNHI